jgi:hypothetical protein
MTSISNIGRLELLKTAVDSAYAEQRDATEAKHPDTFGRLHVAFNEYQAFHAVCFDERGRPRDHLAEAVSFKPELLIEGEGWLANAYRFATALEAISAARALLKGWTQAQNSRATSSTDAPTHTWREGRAQRI